MTHTVKQTRVKVHVAPQKGRDLLVLMKENGMQKTMVVCRWWCDDEHKNDSDPEVVNKAVCFLMGLAKDYVGDKVREADLKSERNQRLETAGIRKFQRAAPKKRPSASDSKSAAVLQQTEISSYCRKRKKTKSKDDSPPACQQEGHEDTHDDAKASADVLEEHEKHDAEPHSTHDSDDKIDDLSSDDGSDDTLLFGPTMWEQARRFAST